MRGDPLFRKLHARLEARVFLIYKEITIKIYTDTAELLFLPLTVVVIEHIDTTTLETKMAPTELKVVSWNVLAHVHTHYDFKLHGGAAKTLETDAQMVTRHQRIVAKLVRSTYT